MKFYLGDMQERIGYDFYCDIAEQVVSARESKGWTQEELAKKSGLPRSRVSSIEGVKVRITLKDVEALAKTLDVSPNWLIQADLDWNGEHCLYLVWNEKFPDLKPYRTATSARMAFLKAYQEISEDAHLRWFGPRDRAVVKLVGVPYSKAELEARFPKRTGEDRLEPPEE